MNNIEENLQSREASLDRETLTQELRGLIDDLQDAVNTEILFQRNRLAYSIRQTKQISLFLAGTAIFSSVALIAFIIGLLFALIPIVGEWGAVAIITLACVILAGICFLVAAIKTRRLKKLYRSNDVDESAT